MIALKKEKSEIVISFIGGQIVEWFISGVQMADMTERDSYYAKQIFSKVQREVDRVVEEAERTAL